MFLTRGIPSVYYGDEVGMIGTGGDKAARQDMFPTQVSWWRSEDRVFGGSIGTGSSLGVTTPLTSRITLLNSLRKAHPALASGSQTIRLSDGNCLVVSRFDAQSKTEYVVAFNSATTARTVTISTATPLTSWQALIGSASPTSNASGEISISIPARSTLVLKANGPIPQADENLLVGLNTAIDSASKSVILSSAVPGKDLGTVTFAVKQNNGPWSVVGADDSRSFGMVWDYQNILGVGPASQTKVSIVAIYKSTSGKISISPIREVTIP
jgi:hypothetical protein